MDNTKINKDRTKSLKFHIENDDYFGTLATVLNCKIQDIQKELKGIERIKDDLMYLQDNFEINRKENKA